MSGPVGPTPGRRAARGYHGRVFGIGAPELIFILVLALLIFGPKRLPQIGRTIGKGMAEFRRASTELQRAINTADLEEPMPPAPRRTASPALQSPAEPAPEPIAPGSGRTAVALPAGAGGEDDSPARPA
jgi:sec-independent protein translocase protein TatA